MYQSSQLIHLKLLLCQYFLWFYGAKAYHEVSINAFPNAYKLNVCD
jgi:hypothetical protein